MLKSAQMCSQATLFYCCYCSCLRAQDASNGLRGGGDLFGSDVNINIKGAGDLTISWFTPFYPKQPSLLHKVRCCVLTSKLDERKICLKHNFVKCCEIQVFYFLLLKFFNGSKHT